MTNRDRTYLQTRIVAPLPPGSPLRPRLVLGSVAAGVLRSASCNLLVVPPEAGRQHDDATARKEELVGADWNYVSDEAPVATAKASSSDSLGEYWFG